MPTVAWTWTGNGAWAAEVLLEVHISNVPVHYYTQAPDTGLSVGSFGATVPAGECRTWRHCPGPR